jgi:hypothetical protein
MVMLHGFEDSDEMLEGGSARSRTVWLIMCRVIGFLNAIDF